NLQPLVLETSALPIELHPCGSRAGAAPASVPTPPRGWRAEATICLSLLGLPVEGVPPLVRTILVELQPVGVVLLVLSRRVVPPLALGARELDHRTRFDSCHRPTL